MLTTSPSSSWCQRSAGPQLDASRSTWWRTWCYRVPSDPTVLRLMGTARIQSERTNTYLLSCSLWECDSWDRLVWKWKCFFWWWFATVLPERTRSLAGWLGSPWAAPVGCYLAWTPPTGCWPPHQTLPQTAGSGCGYPEEGACAHGSKTETLEGNGTSWNINTTWR